MNRQPPEPLRRPSPEAGQPQRAPQPGPRRPVGDGEPPRRHQPNPQQQNPQQQNPQQPGSRQANPQQRNPQQPAGRQPGSQQARPQHAGPRPRHRPVPPPDGRPVEPPTVRHTPDAPPDARPRAWSAEDPRARTAAARPKSELPAPQARPADARPADARPDASVRAAAPGYAPRQNPEPVPESQLLPRRDEPGRSRGVDEPRPDRADRRRDGDARRSAPTPQARRADVDRPSAAPAKTSRKRRRRLLPWILVILLVLLLTPAGLLLYYDTKLHRVDALAAYSGRPANTPGTTWLIVGTDSREDLSQADKDKLATGDSDGARTDTIMLAHLPTSGKAMLISIPRDLYVPIPGMGSHKINAAFNNGGPQLLVQTVEQLTQLRIDHYAEIGFGGFDRLVDGIGGVTMCLNQPLRDPKAGLNLKAGCQELNGAQALGLMRTRAFPNADLERVINQRKFLSALMARASSPAVLLNPFRLLPFLNGAVNSLTVDDGDHIWHLAWLAWKLRGGPITTTAPTGGGAYTDDGDSLIVGPQTEEFFDYLRRGQPVPEELISDGGGAVD